MDFFDVVSERYSFRGMYQPTPVPREHLKQIMQAGLAAPSGCNEQTTCLIGVDDPALMKQLGMALGKPNFASAPAAICVLTKHTVAFADTCYSLQDYGAAIENMLLAITALGYASCWVEGYVTSDEEVLSKMSALLGLPEDVHLVAYLPVGLPKDQGRRAAKKPFDQRAWFNGFER